MVLPTTVNAVLARIADEIETTGHWQGESEFGARVCLVANRTISALRMNDRRDLADAAKHEMRRRIYATSSQDLVVWNDTHPTPEVLAMLRAHFTPNKENE